MLHSKISILVMMNDAL